MASEKDAQGQDAREDAPRNVADEEFEPIVTPKTWVVVLILSLGYGLSFWPIPVQSAIGTQIATAVGDPGATIWFVPAWILAITICFMLAGANTDLLGRRWFLVGGNVICFVGHIVVASATNAKAIIGGMAIAGFGGACCQMAAFALPELLPNKWRHIGVVIADLAVYVSVIVGPVTARYSAEWGTWRWNFYSLAIFQALSFIGLFLLYFPPAHPYGLPIKQLIKELDYVGMILFITGATPALAGIVYTTALPSSDPHVVALLVIGFFFLILFALWETYGKAKHPLTPTRVFTAGYGRDLTAPCIALAVVNMFYYSSSILWPTMITVFYTNGGTDWKYGVLLSIVQGFAICTGAALLTLLGRRLRHWHWQLTGSVLFMVLFGGLLALGTPQRKGMMIAFLFMSQTAYGWAIYLSIAVSQMGVEHRDLGISGGLSGAARFAGGAIAAAVYQSVLANTVTKWTIRLVPSAAIAAGLPASEVTALMGVVGTDELAQNYSPQVVAAVGGAVSKAYEHGIQMTAYTSLAFGMVGIIACLYCKDVDSKMTDKIEVYMENTEYASRNKYH